VNLIVVVLVAAAITFACRVVFLTAPAPRGLWGRFLDVFPLALFVALATAGLAAPGGTVAASPALAAAAGGILGAALTRRSLLGVLVFGTVTYWIVRLLVAG
jgi:branched-subunit amino acid transport protein